MRFIFIYILGNIASFVFLWLNIIWVTDWKVLSVIVVCAARGNLSLSFARFVESVLPDDSSGSTEALRKIALTHCSRVGKRVNIVLGKTIFSHYTSDNPENYFLCACTQIQLQLSKAHGKCIARWWKALPRMKRDKKSSCDGNFLP